MRISQRRHPEATPEHLGEVAWLALGLPSEKVMRQSCGKADKLIVYPYGGRTAEMWWDKIKNGTIRFENLQVINFS